MLISNITVCWDFGLAKIDDVFQLFKGAIFMNRHKLLIAVIDKHFEFCK